jgi:hypothetical protein
MVFSRRISELSRVLIIAPLCLPSTSATNAKKSNIDFVPDAVEDNNVQSAISRELFTVLFDGGASSEATPSPGPIIFSLNSECEVRVSVFDNLESSW